ncbi:Sugar or nucleoside kinase, ribokinase family [Tranquillimonas rosea]|uniref:Sugar or nucleoside kinase, ribokinase family n=1 Tax=Tranquillimonas rosea TaxID=641238 RepID=A0A1H9WY64_9RHOB|nr:adenosine kinase [Tranquillimonas rosea]SES38850.1 Sugar or nucleoside kinase, ribokinase family [Tranquillimonas rosea]
MNETTPHIVGLGNALVDVVAPVEAEVITRHKLTPGGMHLVDAEAAHALFSEVGPGVRQSGGSVANSIAHLADLGVKGTYLGKIAEDDLGATFTEEMRGLGISAPVAAAPQGETGTGRCVVLVTPDGERTMSTFLGAAVTLEPGDISPDHITGCGILFVEGYLWDAPHGPAVIAKAAEEAKKTGAKVALTPSDPGCVERNREAMMGFINDHADILIGNHTEIGALSGTDDTEAAMDWALERVGIVALTEHEKGSLVADSTGRHRVQAEPISKVVDSTGAGDAYASGFLGGLVLGKPVQDAGRMGAELAARVLGHYGARDGAAARAIALPAA